MSVSSSRSLDLLIYLLLNIFEFSIPAAGSGGEIEKQPLTDKTQHRVSVLTRVLANVPE